MGKRYIDDRITTLHDDRATPPWPSSISTLPPALVLKPLEEE
jgi:hypothetical protein